MLLLLVVVVVVLLLLGCLRCPPESGCLMQLHHQASWEAPGRCR